MARRPAADPATSPALDRARERIVARRAHVLREQVELTEIAAPTGEEARRGVAVAKRFDALGLRGIGTDAEGNVTAVLPGSGDGSPVVVCAHLDTVFPAGQEVRVHRDGERLVGPGIGDNGRGLAAMLAVADALAAEAPHGAHGARPILFAATTGEEGSGDLRGAKRLFARLGRDVAAVVVLDGPGDDAVVNEAVGARRFRVEFRGPGGHSWAAYGAPNAVHAAAGCVARLSALAVPAGPRATVSVGRIGGGIAVNAIPEEAWLEVDLRSADGPTLGRLEEGVQLAAREAAREENRRRSGTAQALEVVVREIGNRPAGRVSPDAPLVRAALAATRRVGRVPRLAAASTDGNVPIAHGIPAVTLGGGGLGGAAHTPHEWYADEEGERGLLRALDVVTAAAAD